MLLLRVGRHLFDLLQLSDDVLETPESERLLVLDDFLVALAVEVAVLGYGVSVLGASEITAAYLPVVK